MGPKLDHLRAKEGEPRRRAFSRVAGNYHER